MFRRRRPITLSAAAGPDAVASRRLSSLIVPGAVLMIRINFREPNQMVAGVVAPPRIDIRNRDLVRSHVHAIWMEVAKPDLGKTLTTVLDLTAADGKIPLPLKDTLARELGNPAHRAAALRKVNQLVTGIRRAGHDRVVS
jgi:hypothetical protein